MTFRPTVQALLATVLALALHPFVARASLDDDPRAVSLPLEIEVNGASQGEVIVRANPSLDIVELQGSTLKDLARAIAAAEALVLVESLPDGYLSLEALRERGVEIHIDLERLVIALSIQTKSSASAHAARSIQLGYQRRLNYDQHEPQATFSGYANLRWRSAYAHRDDAPSSIRSSLGIDHAINFKGLALDGDSVWTPEDGFQTKELSLVLDLPKRLLRARFGDLSTPITSQQRGAQLFGVSIAKEFGIQPYRTFTPTSSASFELQENATVFVSVNGRATRTLKLEPGQYNIEDFKLAAGPNSMKLEIRSESGLVDQIDVNEFGALSLLGKGVSTYALSLGLPHAYQSGPDTLDLSLLGFYQRFVERSPLASGYYRRGLSNQLTASVDLQGSELWGRAGVTFSTAAERLGEADLSFSLHRAEGHPLAPSARLSWRRQVKGYDFAASSTYTDREYNLFSPSDSSSPRSVVLVNSLSVSKLFSQKLNVSLSAFDQTRADGLHSRAASLNLGQRFNRVYASLSLRYSSDPQGSNASAFLNFTWSPSSNLRSRSQVRLDQSASRPSLSSSIDYSARNGDVFSSASLNLRSDAAGQGADASYSRRSSHYSASITHREVYSDIDDFSSRGRETALAFETGIAFADGAFGLAERVRDGFAIIDRHAAWSTATLGINPTYGGYEKIYDKGFFKPMLPNLPSYREGYATIQTIDSDLFLERNDFYFFPSYHRGTRLLIGDAAIYSVRSQLFFADGEPVAYRAIQLRSPDGKYVNTFTNSVGRFMAIGLEPGPYRLTIANSPESTSLEVAPSPETLQLLPPLTLHP